MEYCELSSLLNV